MHFSPPRFGKDYSVVKNLPIGGYATDPTFTALASLKLTASSHLELVLGMLSRFLLGRLTAYFQGQAVSFREGNTLGSLG